MAESNENPGTATYQEIISQPQAWAEAITIVAGQANSIRQLYAPQRYDDVLITGCGSTYYLSLAAASLWQTLFATPARAVPAGELFLNPEAIYGPEPVGRTLLVAVSRSGTTTETITATRQFKARGLGDVIVVTNYDDTPLAALGDLVIAIPAGQEKSVAQTRSFASMYVALTALISTLNDKADVIEKLGELPQAGQRLIEEYEPLAKQIGGNLALDRFYFLGSGPRYGLACEANLKMKEMTLTHSEPFHFFEFRHGPMSMVNEQAVVIGLVSEQNRRHELQVLTEMEALGGKTLSLGENDTDVAFSSGLPASIRNVLYLPVLQLMACYRSLAKGLNPDRPNNLSAVIELDLEE